MIDLNYGFQINGTTIYDPNGQEFIIKGTNMFAWEGITNVDSYLNNWGFNTIRVPNYLLGSYNQDHPEVNGYAGNHSIVDAYTSQGAVVIFDAHDLAGSYYQGADFEVLKDYWRDMAREFKDNPYVWFNLHNEPGNATANTTQWVSYHRELIDIIRAEGANNLIVVDGEAWGQDFPTQTIANHAQEIMDGNENIMFSIHVYDRWLGRDIGAYFDTLQNQGIPIMVGEYGVENNGINTLDASTQMMAAAQEREIGRIVWAAKADDNNDLTTGAGGHAEHFDGTNPEILTDLGQLVYNDLQRVEDLEQLEGYDQNHNSTFTDGVFEVDASGQVQFDFLFDGGWFQGELAIFNLEGMEAYTPGSQEFIQEAALRALTNSTQGHVLLNDPTEGARFSSSLPWERDFNAGEYLGAKTFTMNAGDRFAVMLIQHTTVQEIANNPGNIWQWGKLPLFSIPEANVGGVAEGQMVAVDEYGTFAFEDVRVDWGSSDGDYNDVVFQIQGAQGVATSMDTAVNPSRDWRSTAVGQELLAYAASNTSINNNNLFASRSSATETTLLSSQTTVDESSLLAESDLLNTNVDSSIDNQTQIFQGGEQDDVLRGGSDSDIIYGDLGDDWLYGRNNDDLLFGDAGNDVLVGERGNDVLIGGLGNDTLRGGSGSDLFVIVNDGGVDVIEDFEVGLDLIQLSDGLRFEDLGISQVGGRHNNDVIISIADSDRLLMIIDDVSAKDLTAVDFI